MGALVGAIATSLASCAPGIPTPFGIKCPDSFDVGSMQSFFNASGSQVRLYRQGRVVGQFDVPVSSINLAQPALATSSGELLFVGEAPDLRGTLVWVDAQRCSVRSQALDTAPILTATVMGGREYVANTVGGVGRVMRHGVAGALDRTVELPGAFVTALAALPDGVVALTSRDGSRLGATYLDPDLNVVKEIDLGVDGAEVWSAVAFGHVVYFPVSRKYVPRTGGQEFGQEDSMALGALDLSTARVRWMQTGSSSPLRMGVLGDRIWVAHTSLNPAYGPLGSFRHLSALDVRDLSVEGTTLPWGITQVATGRNRLVVTTIGNGASNNVDGYAILDPTTMKPDAQGRVPLDLRNGYLASLFAGPDL